MKIKRLDFNFIPLQLHVCLSVDSSVPDSQNYDADTGVYTPDYSITPLCILPAVSIIDKNDILTAGRVNRSLANIKWYEIIGGTSTLIDSTNTNYSITTSGDEAGLIQVKKNAEPDSPITLQFYAEYVDSRTNQVHTIQATTLIKCGNSTVAIPQLFLDAADATVYNPIRGTASQTVTASLRLGTEECPTANRAFVWEIYRTDTSTWTEVGTDTVMDYDVTVSSDGASVTVDKSLMGDALYLRCRAKYDKNGDPDSVTLTDASPTKVIAFVRRIPKIEADWTGVPDDLPPGQLYIYPVLFAQDANGQLDNDAVFKAMLPLWYMATNKASGTLSYSLVAHGTAPTIKTTPMSDLYGAVLGIDLIDRGPAAAWADEDGAIFVDDSGNTLLI